MIALKTSVLSLAAATWIGFLPLESSADTIVLQPSADATLIATAPDNGLGSADFFNAGTTGGGNPNRALLLFDLSSAIPPGAIITGASLSLSVVREPNGKQNSIFSLRRMLQSWGEGVQVPGEAGPGLGSLAGPGEATWNQRFVDGAAWSQPGGQAGVDYSTVLSSTAFVGLLGDDMIFNSTAASVADVQAWLDNPASNFGWMLRTESEGVNKTARSFASRESGFGPTLTVNFATVPEPSVLSLAGLFLLGLGFRAVQRRATPKR
jgi:hypothetical protein